MISVRPAGQLADCPYVCGKNFNVAIFSDTVNMINVQCGTMVALTELYPFIPLSVSMVVFKGYSSVERF